MKRLQDWLTLQSERRPEACAVVFGSRRATYGELEMASNRLARALKAAGCRRGDRVALLLPKSIEALIAMFAALKADSTYVPMDTASPATRLARMMAVCDTRCVLAERSTAGLLNEIASHAGGPVLPRVGWMDGGATLRHRLTPAFYWGDVLRFCASGLDSTNGESDPAHILFTSGSTGVPKGVVITHSNVIQFVTWGIRYFGIGPSDKISGHPPLHFDLSMFDIYGAVGAGAQLHLAPSDVNVLPHLVAGFIRGSELTQWFSAPSILNHMARFDAVRQHDFPFLKRLLWCGEKFPTPSLMYWMSRLPKVEFFNLYGPTETTIASSCYRVPRCPESATEEIPIGDPCDGEQMLVLDEKMRRAAPGQVGDLYIAGVGLSPGYWGDPQKTAQVFLPHPERPDPSARIYKTGDLARVGDNGAIYLLGRADTQIKSRGYRIELGEIESAAHAVSGIQEVAVVAVESQGLEGTSICCAFVPQPGSQLSTVALKKQLSETLPHYMLPSRWMVVDRLPRNNHGKVDKLSLKEKFREADAPDRSIADAVKTADGAHAA